jgi:3-methyladenine DNA glycosylase AlkD
MHDYLVPLQAAFEQQADPAAAGPMKAYMRGQFEFLGLKSPPRRALLKAFWAEHGLPPLEQLPAIARELWAWPEREYQYTAVELLDKQQRRLTGDYVPLLEELIVTKSWWDTVDALAAHNVGKLFARYPDLRDPTIGRWRGSDNIWLRRTTLLFQLNYKDKTDADLLMALIRENLGSSEFFVNKAIGWALRQYSRQDAAAVQRFVAETALAPLSRREALKWLDSRRD